MMSYVALRQGDSVGLIAFSDHVLRFVPPRGGMPAGQFLLLVGHFLVEIEGDRGLPISRGVVARQMERPSQLCMDAIKEVLTPTQWEQFTHPVAIELKAGECSFHHPLMVHGSFANRGDRPRRATVINVFRDGVKSDSDEPLLTGVPPIPTGQNIDGQFFPLLRDKVS